jgi:hypothetical protein
MKFNLTNATSAELHYEIISETTIVDFFIMMTTLANSFGRGPTFESMPEAEMGLITLDGGWIYAKYDLIYGVDIDCSGISKKQQNQLEEILSMR